MGVTGELVRSVFSKSRSVSSTHDSHVRNNPGDNKRRWSLVRSYLCGEEFNSVIAEEDSASVKSSEATVTQPIPDDQLAAEGDIQSKELKMQNSASNSFGKEEAAVLIQSAFRDFLARRHRHHHPEQGTKVMDVCRQELLLGMENPSRESADTSLEVQTGNSVEVLSAGEGSIAAAYPRMQPNKVRAPATRFKEEWDDSTVSSNVLKMRIQNRMEATTRRERALAYAFAQQLRICSKKKQTRTDGEETNMGWSWLERWMATRLPGTSDNLSVQPEPAMSNQSSMMRKNNFDVGGEERESCGSNEVSLLQFDNIPVIPTKGKDSSERPKFKVKATRGRSRRKTVPNNHCPKENAKLSKKDCPRMIRSASKKNQEFTERSNANIYHHPTMNRSQ